MKIIALPTTNSTTIPVFKISGDEQLHTDKDKYHDNSSEIENSAIYVVDTLKDSPNDDAFIYYEGDDTYSKGIYKYAEWSGIPTSGKIYNIIATTDMNTDLPDVHPDLVRAYCENPEIVITNMSLNFQWEVPKVKVNAITYLDLFSQLFVGKRIMCYTFEYDYGRKYSTLQNPKNYKNIQLISCEILLIDKISIESWYENNDLYLHSGKIKIALSMEDGMGKIEFVD